ncbi:hypothetical protein EMCRGX_G007760 [Ephydatia muelleri]
MIDSVQFKQWTKVDRASLETKILPVQDFLDCFETMLRNLQLHDFTAHKQAQFVKDTKEGLKPGQVLVIADFSENFSFDVQDKVQSFHWNNLQATVHPFVCYFKDDRGQLANMCYVIISECTTHDTVDVHLFQMWHFFATSHGKPVCDGARGTLKRIVTKASLQRPYDNHILTTKDLYEFASQNIKGMDFTFASNEEHYEETKRLEPRFSNCRTIPGTQRQHSFKPVSENTLEVRMFSCDATARREKVICSVKETISNLSSLSVYVTIAYEEHSWIGCILHTNLMENTVTISFLHPHLNAPSYIFPDPPDIIDVDPTDIFPM